MAANTRAVGSMICAMAKVLSAMPTATPTMVSSKEARLMEMECIHGQMEKSMTENGTVDSSMDTVSGRASAKTLTSASGTDLERMVMVCIPGRTATGMRASGIFA